MYVTCSIKHITEYRVNDTVYHSFFPKGVNLLRVAGSHVTRGRIAAMMLQLMRILINLTKDVLY